MKTAPLLSGSILLLAHAPVSAQLLAGEVPDGMSAMDVNYTFTLTEANTSDSIALEFDCDDFQDAWAVLHRGMPEADGPNYAQIVFVDDDIEVCTNLAAPFQVRPKYHDFGDPLDCAGGFEWQINTPLVLGDLGSLIAIGPVTIDSQYVAYKRDGVIGWMLLSFELQGDQAVSLTVHRILSICTGPLSVGDVTTSSGITLFPNPASEGNIHVESSNAVLSIEVLDATGRSIARHNGPLQEFAAPQKVGTYLVRATHFDGRRSYTRLVRH